MGGVFIVPRKQWVQGTTRMTRRGDNGVRHNDAADSRTFDRPEDGGLTTGGDSHCAALASRPPFPFALRPAPL